MPSSDLLIHASRRFGEFSTVYALPMALMLWSVGVSGCGSSGGKPGPSSSLYGYDSGATPSDAGNMPGCQAGETQACVCSQGGVGSQACTDGTFANSSCENCAFVGGDGGPGTYCVPGRYTGRFVVPKYLPAAAGCLWSIWGGSGQGDLAFTLGAGPAGSEFVQVESTESCFKLVTTGGVDGGLQSPDTGDAGSFGSTPDASVAVPSTMGLEGSVDCATGILNGTIKGTYYSPASVCSAFFGIKEQDYYSIKGILVGKFNPKTQAFDKGAIDIQEPQTEAQKILPIGDPFGGHGTWQATLNPDASTPPPQKECYDEAHYMDFDLMPFDAGI